MSKLLTPPGPMMPVEVSKLKAWQESLVKLGEEVRRVTEENAVLLAELERVRTLLGASSTDSRSTYDLVREALENKHE